MKYMGMYGEVDGAPKVLMLEDGKFGKNHKDRLEPKQENNTN